MRHLVKPHCVQWERDWERFIPLQAAVTCSSNGRRTSPRYDVPPEETGVSRLDRDKEQEVVVVFNASTANQQERHLALHI